MDQLFTFIGNHPFLVGTFVLLLALCVFIGAISGFMVALHLLDITIVLKKH